MEESANNFQNHTVFFFNSTSPIKKSGKLKGFKLKSKDEDKLLTLKTKYVQRSELMRARYSFQEKQKANTQRQRASYDNWHYRSLYKRIQPEKRQIQIYMQLKNEQSDMIVTSESNSLSKRVRPRDLPDFSSANLQGKMNEYLNLIIKKSYQSHQQKIKKVFQVQKQKKNLRFHNMFYRRMKMNQNRRKQQRDKERDQQSMFQIDHKINTKEQILNNIEKIKKNKKQLN